MIVSDLDGTLLNKEKTVSAYTREVLARARDAGIKIAYATARPARAIHLLSLPYCDFIIADNGALITENENILYTNPIPDAVARALIEKVIGDPAFLCLTAETGERLFTNFQGSGDSWGAGWDFVRWNFADRIDESIVKFSIECKNKAEMDALVTGFPELHLFPNKGEDWYQVMHAGSTKANGIRILSEKETIPLNQIVAFGDDENDVDMLRACGLGIAMANASDSVKAAANEICLSGDENGVARWIDENLLG